MAKLIITDRNGAASEFPLEKERVTIGRYSSNDIVLNDNAVSGKHAVIVTIVQDSFLEDLDSTNGTLVAGKPISKHPLSDGEEISIGRNTLKYLGRAAEDMDKTMVLKSGTYVAAAKPDSPAAALAATGAHEMPSKPVLGKLKVISGSNQGKELELTKALTTIGKPGVQVAAITRRADGYYIVHVGGASGGKRPLVNGMEIDANAHKLVGHDKIELAGTQMEFLIVEG